MGKLIRTIFENENFCLYEQTTGFYLWDEVLQMNVSMHQKTEQDALLYALKYYQKSYKRTKDELKDLQTKVDAFVNQFVTDEDDDF